MAELKEQVAAATGGLTASVGVATSKFMAKVATELAKPDGLRIVEPGTEVALLGPMPVGVIPGVGPVTRAKLERIGIRTVADLQAYASDELAQIVGKAQAHGLVELAYARDDRPVEPERETKSISAEDTFETDVSDPNEQRAVLLRQARQVATRLGAAGLFGRTVSIKVRLPDFATYTRSRTLTSATDAAETIGAVAVSLLGAVNVAGGVRLLGVGVAGLTDLRQAELFTDEGEVESVDAMEHETAPAETAAAPDWRPGFDVEHDEHGRGWVWGAGLGRVTVRFETRDTPPGPVRTFASRRPCAAPRRPVPDCLTLRDRDAQAVTRWRAAASTRPRNSPWSSPLSGCHCTPSQNGRSGSSMASIVPSAARAVGLKPGWVTTAWWWWQLTCRLSPTSWRTSEFCAVRIAVHP